MHCRVARSSRGSAFFSLAGEQPGVSFVGARCEDGTIGANRPEPRHRLGRLPRARLGVDGGGEAAQPQVVRIEGRELPLPVGEPRVAPRGESCLVEQAPASLRGEHQRHHVGSQRPVFAARIARPRRPLCHEPLGDLARRGIVARLGVDLHERPRRAGVAVGVVRRRNDRLQIARLLLRAREVTVDLGEVDAVHQPLLGPDGLGQVRPSLLERRAHCLTRPPARLQRLGEEPQAGGCRRIEGQNLPRRVLDAVAAALQLVDGRPQVKADGRPRRSLQAARERALARRDVPEVRMVHAEETERHGELRIRLDGSRQEARRGLHLAGVRVGA